MPIALVGLDADDTLWHNETVFRLTQQRFVELLTPFADEQDLETKLGATEKKNLGTYGYGVKGFTLSMLETALDVCGEDLPASIVQAILAAGREMMTHPVEPLPGVPAALERLAAQYRLVLITKGDLFHQESKLAASGLGEFFRGVEIVSEKSAATYRTVFARHGSGEGEALMAGNSVRSDILPALEAGGYAALIPYPLVWEHEAAEKPTEHPRFRVLEGLTELPDWLATLP
ncbi:putative hydrolase of the HAD superfamily [Faunimonas pinastri]|uniref:Putative hydrolase of the HAD superfamily n=1 Tax=Faunimonas pinastri TaxID=1855383 RepID=A0A1H9FYQ9_9HYPH|nr:HAD family hydrolase [Faunimonas pinastri]SEQ43006.1 putative hydrolase of the HAD superfamily [Faunimonas pinastri]